MASAHSFNRRVTLCLSYSTKMWMQKQRVGAWAYWFGTLNLEGRRVGAGMRWSGRGKRGNFKGKEETKKKEKKEKKGAWKRNAGRFGARMVSRESQCRLRAPAPGATHPPPACQLKPWLKPTKCLQMKKELLEVLTAEVCQLHCQRKVVREEQEGIAMTRKAGGWDE